MVREWRKRKVQEWEEPREEEEKKECGKENGRREKGFCIILPRTPVGIWSAL